jgi:sugar diacid utilization regulator
MRAFARVTGDSLTVIVSGMSSGETKLISSENAKLTVQMGRDKMLAIKELRGEMVQVCLLESNNGVQSIELQKVLKLMNLSGPKKC